SSRRRHTRSKRDWSSDVCSSDLTSPSIMQYGTNGLAFVQEIKCLIDPFEIKVVGHEIINIDFAVHVAVDIAGQFGAPLDATKGGTAPYATGHQLERARLNGFPGTGYTDDGRFTPALVAALECRAHDFGIADAFEGVIHAAIGHVDNNLLN